MCGGQRHLKNVLQVDKQPLKVDFLTILTVCAYLYCRCELLFWGVDTSMF